MNEKVCLISHIVDSDGAFPIILSKLIFNNLTVFSCDIGEVDELVTPLLEDSSSYDMVYVVDLNISQELAMQINQNEVFKQKFHVFDHHESQLFLNQYSFIDVVVEQNNRKECGTTLYYQYLLTISDSPLLRKKVVTDMVELIRQMDTYDFSKEKEEQAFNFGSLYDLYGRQRYIEHYYQVILTQDEFAFSKTETTLITIEKERTERYVAEKLTSVQKAIVDGIRVGIVFAEQYRSILGHEMVKQFQEEIDIAIIINLDRSISYRAEKEDVNINVLALPYGGGGHKHVGGSPLPKDIQKWVVEKLFQEVTWILKDDDHERL